MKTQPARRSGASHRSDRHRPFSCPRALLLLALAASATAASADSVWTGISGADWRNASNWSGGVPTGAVTATIANGGSAFAFTGTALAAKALILGGAGGSGGFSLGDNGATTFTTTQTSILGGSGNTGSMFVNNGSTWDSSAADLSIGTAGSGVLAITGGSEVKDTFAIIGSTSGPLISGTVTVDGTGSKWTQTAGIAIGQNGTGSLTVSNHALASNATDAHIGQNAGSVGTVAVNTSGSWTIGDSVLFVGEQGQGDLTVASLGSVTVGGGSGDLRLGNSGAGGSGVLSIGGGYDRTGTNPIDDDTAGTILAASVTGGTGAGTKLVNFNLSDVANGGYTFAPVLAGTLSVQNIGSGVTTLTATSTYTGTTTITNGKFVVDGSIANSSLTTVSGLGLTGPNGILSGHGTTGAVALASSGTIAPGNNVGTLSTGAETWNGGATYVWQINNATGTQGGANGWDYLSINGAISLASTSGSPFTLAIQSLTTSNLPGNAANFNPSASQIWVFAGSTGGITGLSPANIRIDASGFTNPLAPAGTFTITQVGGNLVLNYSPVPEPAAWASAVTLLLGGIVLRRRKT